MGPQKITIAAAGVLLSLGSVAILQEANDHDSLSPMRMDLADSLLPDADDASGAHTPERLRSGDSRIVGDGRASGFVAGGRIDFVPAAPGGAAPVADERTSGAFLEVRVDGDTQALLPAAVRESIERGIVGTTGVFRLTSTRHAIERVAQGRASVAMICRSKGFEPSSDAIGHALLGSWVPALVVHPDNPIRNLPSRQLRDLLRGAISDWSEVGGQSGPIRLVVPADEDGRAAIARAMVPGDMLGAGVPAATDEDRLFKVLNDPFAIAVVPAPLARTHGAKVLTIDGVRPSGTARRRGTYPFGTDLYVVHGRNPDRATRTLLERLLGSERKQLIGASLELP